MNTTSAVLLAILAAVPRTEAPDVYFEQTTVAYAGGHP